MRGEPLCWVSGEVGRVDIVLETKSLLSVSLQGNKKAVVSIEKLTIIQNLRGIR